MDRFINDCGGKGIIASKLEGKKKKKKKKKRRSIPSPRVKYSFSCISRRHDQY